MSLLRKQTERGAPRVLTARLQVGAHEEAPAGAQRHERHAHVPARLGRRQEEEQPLPARAQACAARPLRT